MTNSSETLDENTSDRSTSGKEKSLLVWIALGFGAGLSPKAPGTVGSLWGPLLVAGLAALSINSYLLIPVCVFLFLVGIPCCNAGANYFGRKDPGAIVIDEIAAYPLVHLLVPITVTNFWIGFVLFRFFDILKPWPIKAFEKLPRGWGVMADDTIAALYAMGVFQLIAVFLFA